MASNGLSNVETFFPSTKVTDFFTVASAAVVIVLSVVNILFIFLAFVPLTIFVLRKLSSKIVKYTVDLSRGVFVIHSLGRESSILLDKIVAVEDVRPVFFKFLNVGKVRILTEDGSTFSTYYVDDSRKLCYLLSFKREK